LNLVLVVYTKMSVHFVLNALESVVTMDLSGSMQTSAIPTLDASATAVYEVDLAAMRAVFKFQTDSADFIDAPESDIKYYVDAAEFPVINPANAMMDADASRDPIASGAGFERNKLLVAHDFVRFLALRLFKTWHGVDLFNNEKALLQSLRTICGDNEEGTTGKTWGDIKAKLDQVGMTDGALSSANGAAGEHYMTNADQTDDNICRVLFEQMTKNAISRFNDVVPSTEKQSLPFVLGDSISFKLTINAADGQEELTSVDPIEPRSYEIKLLIVDASDNTEVAADETA